jgi:hypothetical protein
MNNTKRTLSIVAVLTAATLVVGAFAAATAITQSAFAYYQKKKDDKKGDGGNTLTAQINRQKASESGWDNTEEQEAQNLICTHPGNNATCTEEGVAAASAAIAAAKRTCEQCFTTFLTPDQITGVLNGRTPESACPVFRSGVILSKSEFRNALGDARVDPTIANDLIACLRDAGVVFGP